MKQTIKSLIYKSISGEWGDEPTNENAIKVIRTANFTNSGILNLENIVSRSIDREKVENKKLFKGDLIIEKSGGSPTQPVGRVVYFNEDGLFLTNNFTNILRPKINIVYPKYFFYALFNLHRKGKTLKYQNKTTGIINLKLQDYLLEEISLPSYENQIRIANLLEKIETTIAEQKNAIDLLDELLQSKFNEMFYNKVFPIKTIEEVSLNIIDCPHNTPKYLDSISDYPCIRTSEIKNGRIDWSSMKYTDYDGYIQRIERLVPQEGDVIFAREGSVGDAAIVPKNVTLSLGQRVMMFRVNPDLATPEYIWAFIKSNKTQHIIKSRLIGATVSRINISEVRKIQCPLPPLEIQNRFAEIVQQIEIIKTEQEAQLKDLEELYASVSHKVFEGDIDLSKVPFDTSLLPSPVEVTEKEPTEKPAAVLQQEVLKEEIKKVIKPTKGKLTWENVSFKEVADYIQHEFDGYYFNAEMLLRFLREEIGMQVNYFSSAEQKKNPQYENADDFYRFIATALTGENHFLTLEQVFYNAETENILNISFTETDVENLSKKDKKERSGIYFRIKDEAVTS
ncbi:restriction endonuclease subunit S [uncultured Chryseobacterium sp.]|uniref:restriction endonuclease subunit S n=1 Tax=uncultured Chryseobacterium sp. TaxID=259322 RepID=UPI0025FF83AF|nr:restriction endonuclease subunit S [uncultured Chryseobacterium sp.]